MTSLRWELLLDQKPRPIREHLLDEVAKLMADELEQWPLPLGQIDPAPMKAFASLMEPDVPRPPRAAYEEAFRLTRWELARELEACDEYFRNRRWEDRGLPREARTALLFLSRWMVEQMLSLGEATGGKINRSSMRQCLDRIDRRFRAFADAKNMQ